MGRQRKDTEVERLADEIRHRIAMGKYSVHSFLPPERALAEAMGATRAALRNALTLLEHDGLIMRSRGRGARVLPPLERLGKPVIGVVCPEGAFRLPDAGPILRAIQNTLLRAGYPFEFVEVSIKTMTVAAGDDRWTLTADNFQARYGAGLFWEYGAYDDHILALEARRFPLVAANMDTRMPVTATWVDHRKATRCAVDLLAAMGHRRIGFVTRVPEWRFYGQAWEGYLSGLAAHGFARDDALIGVCDGTTPLAGYLAAKKFFALSDRPTGVVAARDMFAHGVCHAIQEAGLTVGRDVSVIGFDDVSWPEDESYLTTFRMPCHEIGAGAAEMLVERIVGGWKPPVQRECEAPLVMRQTVGLAPGFSVAASGAGRAVLLTPHASERAELGASLESVSHGLAR